MMLYDNQEPLSVRLRNCKEEAAAPWVIEEVEKLEALLMRRIAGSTVNRVGPFRVILTGTLSDAES